MSITWRTPLVQIQWCPDLDMREVMRANALSVVGLHGGTRETVDLFQHLLGPSTSWRYGIWPLAKPYGAGGISTCAMVALGLLRRAGADCEDIRDGYHDDLGTGLRVAKSWARSLTPRPAWIMPIPGLRPGVGDVVQVLGPMHVATVIGWDGDVCVTVDGGQAHPDDGLQCIAVRRRVWVDTPHGGAVLGSRVVDGWIDVQLLPYSGLVTVPELVGGS